MNNMNIRHIIKQLMPLSLAQRYMARNSFATKFKQTGYNENCDFPRERSKFKTIISIQGFGYSGSGALVDFLREYPNISVLGYVDKADEGGGLTPKSMQVSEIDFVRLSGGLFEIEKYLDSSNIFFNDALLNRTAKLFGNSSLYLNNAKIRDLMYRFFAHVAYLRLENLGYSYYNTYTVGLNETQDIYFLKKMSRNEYQDLCRNFLSSVFNEFYQSGKDFLAADQLLSDMEFNMERNLEYIPNLKMVIVTRDPRDTYCWAIKRNIEWMEHSSPQRFVEWYKHLYANVNSLQADNRCLVLKYEDLVLDYDKQEKRINEYLGTCSEDHKLRQQFFNPDVSKRFVGIYKEFKDYEKDFAYIRNELSNYCNTIID